MTRNDGVSQLLWSVFLFVGVLGSGSGRGGRRYLEGRAGGGMEVLRDLVIPWGDSARGGSREEQRAVPWP